VILRLGGVIPIELDSSRGVDLDDFFASDLSSRIEYVHPLDVGLAQTRAIACDEAQGRVLLIGGGASSQIYMRDLLTAFFEAVGIGAPLDSWFNGDPFYTDWMDSEESQRLLAYQRHDFPWYRADLHDRMRVTRLFVRPLRWPIRGYLSYRSRVSARREGVVK
jgi:UDP-glucose 4-epimerase